VLLLKIILAPVLIALVSLAGRKWGPGIAGWLLGLPLSSGPILFFLVLEQGRQFASHAAVGSLLGIIAWASSVVVYAYSCLKLSWRWSTLLAWMAYFVVAGILLLVKLNIVWVFLLVCTALAFMLLVFPKASKASLLPVYGRYDLILRMATACVMVLTLTGLARILGPTRSGILSAFPAYTTILAVFSHLHGAAAAVKTLKGILLGLYTAATFFLILSPALIHLTAAVAFGLAVAGALLVQATSLFYMRRAS
jgi:hypothetical protein